MSVQSQIPARAILFTQHLGFRTILNKRVSEFLEENQLPARDVPAMYVKSAIIISWWICSYLLLLLGNWPWYINLLLCLSFAFAMGGIGFNIMHDANHGSYSENPKVNRILGFFMEPLGASTFVWRQTHNIWHHTYTNIAGLDDDLETEGLMRMTPHEAWKPGFRFQHWYVPFVYGLTLFGYLLRDFRIYFTGRSSTNKLFPPMKVSDRVIFWVGKITYFLIIIGFPLLVFPWWQVLVGAVFVLVIFGLILASIFQLAHVMPVATFPKPVKSPTSDQPPHIENDWAIHEIETTVNFAPRNRLLSWYAGGLNFQIEHHLFPRISHVNYAKIAPIVRRTCEEFGVCYNSYTTWLQALVAHWRALKRLGQAPAVL